MKHHLKKKEKLEHIEGDFIVIGLDLSLKSPGFCVLKYSAADRTVSCEYVSSVDNSKYVNSPRGLRLSNICSEMAKIITTYGEASHAEYVVVRENSFSRFNAETQAISAVNGVCELTVWDIAGKDVQLIAPVSVKKITTGSAKASKEDVAASLNFYCPEHPEFKVNDESDAMGVAVAWLIDNGYLEQRPLDKFKEDENQCIENKKTKKIKGEKQ